MKMEICFVVGDTNANGQPDVHVEIRVGNLVMRSPTLDGPSIQEVIGFAQKLLGLGGSKQ